MTKISGINWFESLESTNRKAGELMADCDNLSVIAAVSQTAGRGRGGHKWLSDPGLGLTFSMVLKYADPPLPVAEEDSISHLACLSVSEYLHLKGISSAIKRPNDVWVDGKKICGVLVEHMLCGSIVTCSIVGIGLNLNATQFPPNLPNPTSLAILTGSEYDPGHELEILYSILCRRAESVCCPEGRLRMREEFERLAFTPHEGL